MVGFSFKQFMAPDATAQRDRSAFVYFERDEKDFSQCSSCGLQRAGLCLLLDINVTKEDSCALYIPGPSLKGEPKRRMSLKEAGFVHAQVRCENCSSFNDGTCKLFEELNTQGWDCDPRVKPRGCCNAWSPGA